MAGTGIVKTGAVFASKEMQTGLGVDVEVVEKGTSRNYDEDIVAADIVDDADVAAVAEPAIEHINTKNKKLTKHNFKYNLGI